MDVNVNTNDAMDPPAPWAVPGRTWGVDVSAAQAGMDQDEWTALAAAGVRFLYHKASEALNLDGSGDGHRRHARAAGIELVSAYHYLHSSLNGRLQAEHAFRTVEAALAQGEITLRFMLDWEDQRRIETMGPDGWKRARDCAVAFRDRADDLFPHPILLYTYPGFVGQLHRAGVDLSALASTELEIAHYRWDPGTGKDYRLTHPIVPDPWGLARFWQCAGNKGPRVPGVRRDLDLDVWFDTVDALAAWGRGERAQAIEVLPWWTSRDDFLVALGTDHPDLAMTVG